MRSLGCTQSGINYLLRACNTHDIHSTERFERWTRIGISNQFLNRNDRSRAKTDRFKTISREIMHNLLSKQSNIVLIGYLFPRLVESLNGVMSNIIGRKNLCSIISHNIVVIELTISIDEHNTTLKKVLRGIIYTTILSARGGDRGNINIGQIEKCALKRGSNSSHICRSPFEFRNHFLVYVYSITKI